MAAGQKLIVASNGYSLQPRDAHSEDLIRGMSRGVDALCHVNQPRNLKQLRFMYAVFKKIADNHPELHTVEAVKRELKIRCRMFDPISSTDGRAFYTLRSMSFEMMDQTEFAWVWQQFRQCIVHELMPGLTSEALSQELLEML
ncbi:hypothetical protein [uncultured Hyphomicrobium sp.]|uniref:hypothetical protein n=1 Tax=uncultured Hyphomicrobium sp. TaxID=194373 RepID=UPI0025DF7ADA|nr:hypothetical protein [uncultured Hyphomicrobium sp.]